MTWLSVLLLVGVAALIPTAYAAKIGAPYVPTYRRAIIAAFDFIRLGPPDTLFDLGAGDGKVVRLAAARGAKALGFELSPIMWLVAVLRTMFRPRAHIRYGNFYKQSLGEATVIFAFLMPQNMERVRRFLASQRLPHGRFFLSYMFPFRHLEPVKIIRQPRCGPVYVYDLPALSKPL